MKITEMTITFEELDSDQMIQTLVFLQNVAGMRGVGTQAEARAEVKASVAPEVKLKRKRRTKAEMKAARAAVPLAPNGLPYVNGKNSDNVNEAQAAEAGGEDASGGGSQDAPRVRQRKGNDAVGRGSDTPRRRKPAPRFVPAAGDVQAGTPAGRRRRPGAGARSPEPVEATTEITDQDLAKAATTGAEVITPNGIMEILEQFGVASVQDLAQDKRREFLDSILDAMEVVSSALGSDMP